MNHKLIDHKLIDHKLIDYKLIDHNKYINCVDIIYWINLDRSHIRRYNMIKLLEKFNIQNIRIPACDGKTITDNELYNSYIFENYNSKKSSTKIEYACLLSHLTTIDLFSQSSHNIALIFEDDLSLEFSVFWNKSLCQIMNDAPADWDIIMLNYVYHEKMNNLYTLNAKGEISSCLTYLITKKGAQKLMNKIKILNKYKLNKKHKHTADDFIYANLITYTYKYSYFTYPNDNDSTIHNDHLNYHQISKNIMYNDWLSYYNIKPNVINKINTNYILLIMLLFIIIFYVLFNMSCHKKKLNQIKSN
jgi:GR25 family glycosyltransferase involved in LPS biosynthesis